MHNVLSGRHLSEYSDAVRQLDYNLIITAGACGGGLYPAGTAQCDLTLTHTTIGTNLRDRADTGFIPADQRGFLGITAFVLPRK